MTEKYFIVAKSITRWKLDNQFENWLSYKADESEFWKRLYVLYYIIFDYKYHCCPLKNVDDNIKFNN